MRFFPSFGDDKFTINDRLNWCQPGALRNGRKSMDILGENSLSLLRGGPITPVAHLEAFSSIRVSGGKLAKIKEDILETCSNRWLESGVYSGRSKSSYKFKEPNWWV